jgi:hypothetical protein
MIGAVGNCRLILERIKWLRIENSANKNLKS